MLRRFGRASGSYEKRSGGNRDHRFVAFRGPRCGLRYERFLHTRRGAFSTPMAECDPRRNHRHLRGSAAWDDPTNGPDVGDSGGNEPLPANYPLRSRIRHDLMPYLASFAGSDVVSKLALGARLAEDDRAYLDDVAQRVCEQGVTVNNGEIIIDVRALQSQDIAIRRRVIVRSLAEAGISCMARQVEGIDRLICDWHGQKGVNLPSGYSAYRQKHVIRVCQDGGHANR